MKKKKNQQSKIKQEVPSRSSPAKSPAPPAPFEEDKDFHNETNRFPDSLFLSTALHDPQICVWEPHSRSQPHTFSAAPKGAAKA